MEKKEAQLIQMLMMMDPDKANQMKEDAKTKV